MDTPKASHEGILKSSDSSPKESIQGLETQESDKSGNTIITRDAGQVISAQEQLPLFGRFASSEESIKFQEITSRWIALSPVPVATNSGQGTLLSNYIMPEFLFQNFSDVINLSPFSTFVYSELEFEFKFVVNASRFHCGKVVASYRNDPYLFTVPHNTPQAALMRPHVILDLASNAEGVLKVPFIYHRAFVRNANLKGSVDAVRAGYCSLISMWVLSQCNTGLGGASVVHIRPFVRISKANFYGMSYRTEFIQTQMDTAKKIVNMATPPAIRSVLRGIEIVHDLTQGNADKPSDYQANSVVPTPLVGFCWGKGVVNAVPLRNSPASTTVNLHTNEENATDLLDIARIWGLRSSFAWSTADKAGQQIMTMKIDPTMRNIKEPYAGTPTPVEYVTSMFNFWSGTLQVRLDFVSTPFHSGAVTLAAEFGRLASGQVTPWKSMQSSYTKTFHLGEQRSVEFTIPYIYDTPWRRSNQSPLDFYPAADLKIARDSPALVAVQEFHASFSVYVMNELIAPSNASQNIEVLVFWRASPTYRVHSLTQCSMWNAFPSVAINTPEYTKRTIDDTHISPQVMGTSYLWKDILPDLASMQRGIASTGGKTQNKRDTSGHTDTSQIDPVVNVDDSMLIRGKLPNFGEKYICINPDNPRDQAITVSINLQLLRSASFKDKYSQILMFPIYTVSDSYNPSSDHLTGYMRYADMSRETKEIIKGKGLVSGEVETQMDNGDPTGDFALGSPALHVQTTDSQTNIKDILRRPVMIFELKKVPGYTKDKTAGFVFPVTSPDFFAKSQASALRVSKTNCANLQVTPQAAICSMYRYWRGSSRYTIIIHPTHQHPVYITYMPHSGVHLYGEYKVDVGSEAMPSVAGSGLATHMIIPSVNTVATVEVPFDTENLWCFTNVSQVYEKGAHRDRHDANAGHVWITCPEDTYVSVFWSAGDDYELGNFYGIMKCGQSSHLRGIKEVQTQMGDFITPKAVKNAARTVNDLAEKVTERLPAFDKAVDSVKHLGSLGDRVGELIPSVNETLTSVKRVSDKLGVDLDNSDSIFAEIDKKATNLNNQALDTMANINTVTTEATALVGEARTMLMYCREQLAGWLNNAINTVDGIVPYITIVRDLIMDLSTSIVTRSWYAVAMGVVRLLANAFNLAVDRVNTYMDDLHNWILKWIEPHTQADTIYSSLVGILASIVGVAFKTPITGNADDENLFKKIMQALTDSRGIQYINGMIRLVQTIFSCVSGLVERALMQVNPEVRALKELCLNSEKIDTFVREADIVTSEINRTMLKDMRYRHRVWMAVLQAMTYNRALAAAPQTVATRSLIAACKKVLDFANNNCIDMTSSPVRMEPFVLSIFGSPGLGKSHLAPDLADTLLCKAGYKYPKDQLSYVRQPGMEFWDGFANQPVVIYDDWGNIRTPECFVSQIKELYQLKTPNEMIVNMAEISKKGMKATPLMVILCANDDFPNDVASVSSSPEAVYRRRDILIKADWAVGWTRQRVQSASIEELSEYPHLLFYIHRDPSDCTKGYGDIAYSYAGLKEELGRIYLEYHAKKSIMLDKQIKRMLQDFRAHGIGQNDISNPYQAFWDLRTCTDFVKVQPSGKYYIPLDDIQKAVDDVNALLSKIDETAVKEVADENDVETQSAGATLLAACAGFTLQTITSTSSIAAIRNLLSQANTKILQSPPIRQLYPTKQCFACLEEKECMYVCGKHAHFCCLECTWKRNVNCSCYHTDHEWYVCVTQTTKSYMVWLKAGFSDLLLAAHSKAGTLQDLIQDPIWKYLILFQKLSFFATSVTQGIIPTIAQVSGMCLESLVPRARSVHRLPLLSYRDIYKYKILQEDNVEVQSGSPEYVLQYKAESIEGCIGVTAEALDAFCDSPLNDKLTKCRHDEIMAQAEFVRYQNKGWSLFEADGKEIRAEYRPCSEMCPLRDPEKALDMFKQILDYHGPFYSEKITKVYNNNGIDEHNVLDTVPPLFIPKFPTAEVKDTADDEINSSDTKVTKQGFFSKYAKKWWELLGQTYERYKSFFRIAAGIGVVLVSFAGTWKLVSYLTSKRGPPALPPTDPECQNNVYDSGRAANIRRAHREVKIRPVNHREPETQASNHVNETIAKIGRNMILIRLVDESGAILSLLAQGLFGHTAMLPKHYVKPIRDHALGGNVITLEPASHHVGGYNNLRHTYTYDANDFYSMDDNDLAFFRLPKTMPMFKDIRPMFAKDKDILENYIDSNALMVVGPLSTLPYIHMESVQIYSFVPMVNANQGDGSYAVSRDALCYSFSEKGACGSLLLSRSSTRPILSMHTSGVTDGRGYGVLITQELLQETLKDAFPLTQMDDLHGVNALSDTAFIIDSYDNALMYHGELPSETRPHIPMKTKIMKSAIFGKNGLTSSTETCILSKADKRYTHPRTPLYYGVEKHGKRTKDFPSSLLEDAMEGLYMGWFQNMIPNVVSPKRLSYEQAVTGFPGLEFYDPLKLNTSSGYPWSLDKRGTFKDVWIKPHFDEKQQMIGCDIDPALLSALISNERKRKEGFIIPTLFVDTLKDERKAKEKVLKPGGTRVFCASPVDYTIAMRQNLLHFCAAFMKNRMNVMSAVGINAKGTEWTELYRRMTHFGGRHIMQADYSNFGPGFNASVAHAAATIMVRWTMANVEGVNEKELWAIMYECIQSMHIAGGTVYQQFAGSPSGAAFTVVINSLVNMLYVLVAWRAIMRNDLLSRGFNDVYAAFRYYTRLVVYGDDLIMAVSPDVVPLFNNLSFSQFLSKFDIVATSTGDKSAAQKPYENIGDVSFLKRSFVPHPVTPDYVVGPLAWNIIEDITQWVWKGADLRAATEINVEAALLEAHAHGPIKFQQFQAQVNKALSRSGCKVNTMNWKDLDEKWFKGLLFDYGKLEDKF